MRRSEAAHRRRAERLTATLAALGPTFIKLAQVFGARADILPEPYLSAIGTLTDSVPPLAPGVAERVIREELGADAATVFERFDPVPLAAARSDRSTRAVHQGRDVVVKVLRPGVEDLVRRDPSTCPSAFSSCSRPLSDPKHPRRQRDRERVREADLGGARFPRGGKERRDACAGTSPTSPRS